MLFSYLFVFCPVIKLKNHLSVSLQSEGWGVITQCSGGFEKNESQITSRI